MVFRQTVNASCRVWFILTQFFRELTEEEKIQLLHAEWCHSSHSKLLIGCVGRVI